MPFSAPRAASARDVHASALLWPALLCALVLAAAGCTFFEEPFELETTVPGLVQASARSTDFRAYDALEAAVRADGQAVLVTRVEFSEAARSNGIDLLPTRVALINAAGISQPLVATDPLIALEFPQPLLLYNIDEERVVAGYNTADYLAQRYNVAGLPALDDYEERWRRFTQAAAATGSLVGPGPGSVALHEGIVTTPVALSVDDTYRVLNQAVRDDEDLQLVARYDHTGGTEQPVLTMLFNQPATSARLANVTQTAAIDALLRFVIYEDAAGQTMLAYVAPSFVAMRHGLGDRAQSEVAGLQALLDGLVAEVIARGEDG